MCLYKWIIIYYFYSKEEIIEKGIWGKNCSTLYIRCCLDIWAPVFEWSIKKISILILEVPRFSSVSLLDWHKPVYNMYYKARVQYVLQSWIGVLVYVFCTVPFGIHILCVYTLKLASTSMHVCSSWSHFHSKTNTHPFSV